MPIRDNKSKLVINDDVHMLVGGVGIKGKGSPTDTLPTVTVSSPIS